MDLETPTWHLFTDNLAHPEKPIREELLHYFDDRPDTTAEHAGKIIDALEAYGPEAYAYQHLCYRIPLDAASGNRLLALLNDWTEPSAQDSRARYLTWIVESIGADAEFAATLANIEETYPALSHVQILPSRVRFREAVVERLAVTSLPETEAWERFEALVRKMVDCTEFPGAEVSAASRLLRHLVRIADRDLLIRTAEAWLEPGVADGSGGEGDWKTGLGVYLAEHLQARQFVPRLLALFGEDWDWMNESIQSALVAMNHRDACADIAAEWADLPDHGRLYAARAFAALHFPDFADFYIETMDGETEWEPVRNDFAVALAHLATEDSLERALDFYDEDPDDPEREQIVSVLHAHYTLRDIAHPARQRIREHAEERQQQDDSIMRMIGASEPPVKVPPKPGRNDPCPCGSGKKYKKCCLR